MERAKTLLDRVLFWITVVLFAVLVVIVVWQVLSRQVLGAPSTWTEEGARMTFVWLGLFASAFVFGERGHIAVEVVARTFSEARQRTLGVIVQAIVFAFAVLILMWGGTAVALNAWTQNLSALPFTLGQMYLALPIAGVQIAFYAVYFLRKFLRGETKAYPPVTLDDPEATVVGRTRDADAARGSLLLDDEPGTGKRGA